MAGELANFLAARDIPQMQRAVEAGRQHLLAVGSKHALLIARKLERQPTRGQLPDLDRVSGGGAAGDQEVAAIRRKRGLVDVTSRPLDPPKQAHPLGLWTGLG